MVLELLSDPAYGGPITAAGIIVASFLAAKIIMFLLERVVLHVTSKTKTTLDDAILGAIRTPLYTSIILAGVYFSIDYLNIGDLELIRSGFGVVWILLGAFTAGRIVKALFAWYAQDMSSRTKTHVDDNLMPIIRKLINVFIYAIALLLILNLFNINITPMLAGLGIGGLVIALALQDSLSNLFSGAFIASDGSIKVGDFVELEGGLKGFVEEIGWRTTKIRTLPNNLVLIPNSKLAESVVTDYSAPADEMAVVIQVGVSYDSDLEKVEHTTIEVARHIQKTTEGAIKDFEPFVRFHTFADSNINFSVIMRVQKYVDQYLLTHDFIKALKKRYDKEGIEISYPVRKIVGDK